MPPRKNRNRKMKPRSKKPVARLSKPVRRAIKNIVRGEAETKYTNWYQTLNTTGESRATGFLSGSGWAVQNQSITNNELDILRVIPTVIEGTGDFNRIGARIRPVSLKVRGQVRVRLDLLNSTATLPTNFTVDLYVIQHRRLKDYTSLYSLNNFAQFLETGEGGTTEYTGISINSGMRVSQQNYTVLQRKRITLRYAGVVNGVSATAPYSVANAHTFYAEYSLNLTKHLPKVLQYSEAEVNGSAVDPLTLNAPTNSSIFMCMGYPSWTNSMNNGTAGSANNSFLEQTYVSELGFKDS